MLNREITTLLIFLSLAVTATAEASPESAGKIARVEGVALRFDSKGKSEKLHEGSAVYVGDKLQTREKGSIKLVLNDQSEMNLGPSSAMTVDSYDNKDNKSSFSMLMGNLRAKVKKAFTNEPKMFIKSSTSTMGVRGTDFETTFNPQTGATSLVTFEGAVAMAKTQGAAPPTVSQSQGQLLSSVASMAQNNLDAAANPTVSGDMLKTMGTVANAAQSQVTSSLSRSDATQLSQAAGALQSQLQPTLSTSSVNSAVAAAKVASDTLSTTVSSDTTRSIAQMGAATQAALTTTVPSADARAIGEAIKMLNTSDVARLEQNGDSRLETLKAKLDNAVTGAPVQLGPSDMKILAEAQKVASSTIDSNSSNTAALAGLQKMAPLADAAAKLPDVSAEQMKMISDVQKLAASGNASTKLTPEQSLAVAQVNQIAKSTLDSSQLPQMSDTAKAQLDGVSKKMDGVTTTEVKAIITVSNLANNVSNGTLTVNTDIAKSIVETEKVVEAKVGSSDRPQSASDLKNLQALTAKVTPAANATSDQLSALAEVKKLTTTQGGGNVTLTPSQALAVAQVGKAAQNVDTSALPPSIQATLTRATTVSNDVSAKVGDMTPAQAQALTDVQKLAATVARGGSVTLTADQAKELTAVQAVASTKVDSTSLPADAQNVMAQAAAIGNRAEAAASVTPEQKQMIADVQQKADLAAQGQAVQVTPTEAKAMAEMQKVALLTADPGKLSQTEKLALAASTMVVQSTVVASATPPPSQSDLVKTLADPAKSVMVTQGQFSTAAVTTTTPTIPVKISPAQLDSLKASAPGQTNSSSSGLSSATSTASNGKAIISPIPPGLDPKLVATSSTEVSQTIAKTVGALPATTPGTQTGMPQDVVASATKNAPPAEGFYDAKSGRVAPPAGGFVDMKTGVYVPPPPGSAFDAVAGVYVPPPSVGSFNPSTGSYVPPAGFALDASKGLVLASSLDKTQLANATTNPNSPSTANAARAATAGTQGNQPTGLAGATGANGTSGAMAGNVPKVADMMQALAALPAGVQSTSDAMKTLGAAPTPGPQGANTVDPLKALFTPVAGTGPNGTSGNFAGGPTNGAQPATGLNGAPVVTGPSANGAPGTMGAMGAPMAGANPIELAAMGAMPTGGANGMTAAGMMAPGGAMTGGGAMFAGMDPKSFGAAGMTATAPAPGVMPGQMFAGGPIVGPAGAMVPGAPIQGAAMYNGGAVVPGGPYPYYTGTQPTYPVYDPFLCPPYCNPGAQPGGPAPAPVAGPTTTTMTLNIH